MEAEREKIYIVIVSDIVEKLFTNILKMSNVLNLILNIVNRNNLDLISGLKNKNRINAVGDKLEFFIKRAFSNSFDITLDDKDKDELAKINNKFFSWLGNSNNPPDLILKFGDAVEVKKISIRGTDIALNSSYPKSKLSFDDPMITKGCRECEKSWTSKDLIYAIGHVEKDKLKLLWLIYGDCYAADKEVYERIRDSIYNGVNQIEGIEFSSTKELGRINKVDPLGITYLRVRGMWGISNPINVYASQHTEQDEKCNFQVIAIMQIQKYLSFSLKDRQELEDLASNSKIKMKDVKIKSPNNPAIFLDVKIIIYKK